MTVKICETAQFTRATPGSSLVKHNRTCQFENLVSKFSLSHLAVVKSVASWKTMFLCERVEDALIGFFICVPPLLDPDFWWLGKMTFVSTKTPSSNRLETLSQKAFRVFNTPLHFLSLVGRSLYQWSRDNLQTYVCVYLLFISRVWF